MKQKPFNDPMVEAVFAAYPRDVRASLMALRHLIFEIAEETEGVGKLTETLKWGQPSYLTTASGSGTTLRIDALKDSETGYALYFSCRTNIAEMARSILPENISLEGTRAILLDTKTPIPVSEISQCIKLVLTYKVQNTAPL